MKAVLIDPEAQQIRATEEDDLIGAAIERGGVLPDGTVRYAHGSRLLAPKDGDRGSTMTALTKIGLIAALGAMMANPIAHAQGGTAHGTDTGSGGYDQSTGGTPRDAEGTDRPAQPNGYAGAMSNGVAPRNSHPASNNGWQGGPASLPGANGTGTTGHYKSDPAPGSVPTHS